MTDIHNITYKNLSSTALFFAKALAQVPTYVADVARVAGICLRYPRSIVACTDTASGERVAVQARAALRAVVNRKLTTMIPPEMPAYSAGMCPPEFRDLFQQIFDDAGIDIDIDGISPAPEPGSPQQRPQRQPHQPWQWRGRCPPGSNPYGGLDYIRQLAREREEEDLRKRFLFYN